MSAWAAHEGCVLESVSCPGPPAPRDTLGSGLAPTSPCGHPSVCVSSETRLLGDFSLLLALKYFVFRRRVASCVPKLPLRGGGEVEDIDSFVPGHRQLGPRTFAQSRGQSQIASRARGAHRRQVLRIRDPGGGCPRTPQPGNWALLQGDEHPTGPAGSQGAHQVSRPAPLSSAPGTVGVHLEETSFRV